MCLFRPNDQLDREPLAIPNVFSLREYMANSGFYGESIVYHTVFHGVPHHLGGENRGRIREKFVDISEPDRM